MKIWGEKSMKNLTSFQNYGYLLQHIKNITKDNIPRFLLSDYVIRHNCIRCLYHARDRVPREWCTIISIADGDQLYVQSCEHRS